MQKQGKTINLTKNFSSVPPLKFSKENPYEICNSDEVKKIILASMNQLAQENKFNSIEKPKMIHLCAQEFVKENPEMITPSFKLKRNVAAKHFKSEIDFMYKSL